MDIFVLPKFKENRFEKKYIDYIGKLVDKIKKIKNNIKVKRRVEYVNYFVHAFNNKTPEVMKELNIKYFKKELEITKQEYQNFVCSEIRFHVNKIKYKGSTYKPYSINVNCERKKVALKKQLRLISNNFQEFKLCILSIFIYLSVYINVGFETIYIRIYNI